MFRAPGAEPRLSEESAWLDPASESTDGGESEPAVAWAAEAEGEGVRSTSALSAAEGAGVEALAVDPVVDGCR
jgi:hypothetical protein